MKRWSAILFIKKLSLENRGMSKWNELNEISENGREREKDKRSLSSVDEVQRSAGLKISMSSVSWLSLHMKQDDLI